MASIRKIANKKGISFKIEISNGYNKNGKKLRVTTTYVPEPGMTAKQAEKAARKFADEFEDRVKNGNRISGDKTTLNDFVTEWLKTYAENQLEKTTLHRYKYVLDKTILPALGHMKVGKIKPYDVERFFVSLTKDGARNDGRPGGYSHESIRKAKTVLSSILSTAEQWEVIENNPCRKAHMPKHEETEEKVKAYTLDQIRRFLQFAEDDYRNGGKGQCGDGKVIPISSYPGSDIFKLQTLVIIYIAVFGGLRRGEMVGLDWESVDFDRNEIYIRQSAARVGSEAFVKQPKSKCSIRRVAFPSPVMELLKELQQEQSKYRRAIGDKWNGAEDCVFIQMDGIRMNINSPYHNYQRLLKQYNKIVSEDMQLPILSLHCLRHTNASLLIRSNKTDIVSVSKKLGHADPNVTAKYYLHSYEEGEQETASILEDMILENNAKVAK